MLKRIMDLWPWLLSLLLTAIFMTALFYNLKANTGYFYTLKEALDKQKELIGTTIRIGALVLPGSIKHDMDKTTFLLSDMAEHELTVNHYGSMPHLFRDNQGVVVEGSLTKEGVFISHRLLVKHSEKYQIPAQGETQDKKSLLQTLIDEK